MFKKILEAYDDWYIFSDSILADLLHKLVHQPINNAKLDIKKAKWSLQRAKRGYSDEDLWAFDGYLAQVIEKALGEMAETEFLGHPTGLVENCTCRDFNLPEDGCAAEWKRILHFISDNINAPDKAMGQGCPEDVPEEWDGYKKNVDEALKKQEEALKLLTKHWNHLWC
jgi:hypothetical protein